MTIDSGFGIERGYQRLADLNAVGTIFWEIDGPIVDANDRFLEMIGRTRDMLEAGTIDWVAMTPPEYRDEDAVKVAELRTLGFHGPYAKHYLRPDGTRVPVRVASAMIEGSGRRGVSIVVDDTELHRARELQQRETERLAILSEASGVLGRSVDVVETAHAIARAALPRFAEWAVVDLLDEGGTMARVALAHVDPRMVEAAHELERRWPPRFEEDGLISIVARTGTPVVVAEITDEMIAPYLHDAEHFEAWKQFRVRSVVTVPISAGDVTLGVLSLFATDGRRRFTHEDLSLATELGSRAAAALLNARAFERERRAVASAEAANRAKSEFLAVMSHELRTPLNAIGGYAELLELGIHGPVTEDQRTALARIQASQRHLLGLINQVLNYARIDAGAVRYVLEDLRVRDAIVAAEALVMPQTHVRGLGYAVDPVDAELRVRVDREKLQQILLNLLGNAIKFTEPGGSVRVSCAREGDRVHITIADTGIGIAPERLTHIFEPFVQIDQQLTRRQDGVGLGLAISRDLARGMGGDITAESVLGRGSRFTVVMPACPDEGG